MPDYLLLIYEDENRWENAGPETLADVLAWHGTFAEKYGTSIRGGHALQPTPPPPASGTTLTVGHRHRWSVCRDQGGHGRLLPDRGGRPG